MNTKMNRIPIHPLVTVLDGDITDIEVDVILNSANSLMILGGSRSIAGRILAKTKGRVQRELSNDVKYPKPVQLGEIIETKNFGLPCKHIFHLSTHGTRQQEVQSGLGPEALILKVISSGIEKSILKAEELSCESLAVPLIATGTLELPMSLALEAHLNAITTALVSRNFTALKKIIIVVHHKPDIVKELEARIESSLTLCPKICGPAQLYENEVEQLLRPQIGAEDLSLTPAPFEDHEYDLCEASPAEHGEEIREDVDSETDNICESCPERLELSKLCIEVANLKEELRVAHEALKRLTVDSPLPAEAPLPIAYAYNMVKAEIDPMLKMERLRRALGIVLRYFSSIVFADYHAKGCFDQTTNVECRSVFSKPVTDGSWHQAAIKITDSYKSNKESPFLVQEILSLWSQDKKGTYVGLCHGLIQLRNEIHDKIAFDKSSAEAWLKKALPKWEGMLKAAEPLIRYKLMYVEGIEDFLDNENILYHVKWISGEHLIPKSELVPWREKLKKGKLYLVDAGRGASLDLAPFMAYEFSSITKTKEAYCIEQVHQGKIEFATLRFPHKEELPGYKGPIFTRLTT